MPIDLCPLLVGRPLLPEPSQLRVPISALGDRGASNLEEPREASLSFSSVLGGPCPMTPHTLQDTSKVPGWPGTISRKGGKGVAGSGFTLAAGAQSVKCQQGPRATVPRFALRRAVLPAELPVGARGRGEGPRPELCPASCPPALAVEAFLLRQLCCVLRLWVAWCKGVGALAGGIPGDYHGGACLNAHLLTGEGRDWRRGRGGRKDGNKGRLAPTK